MRVVLRLIFLLFVIGSCTMPGTYNEFSTEKSNINLQSIDDLYDFLTYSDKRIPLVSAHRGGAGPGFPENAIETFENVARNQPVIIECDIAITKDSVLVLMHDNKIDRTTTGTGLLRNFTHKELQGFKLKDTEGKITPYLIPSLEKALEWGSGKVIYTLDVKRGVPYELVIDAIRKMNAEAYSIIITYSAGQVAKIHTLAPDLMISASIRKPDDLLRINDLGVPDNRLIAFVGNTEVQPETYQFLHEHGVLCILGTMGNLDKQAEVSGDVLYFDLIDRGADILSTNRPVEAGIQLSKYRKDYRLVSEFIK